MKLRNICTSLLSCAALMSACGSIEQGSDLKRNAVPNDESIRIARIYQGNFEYDWILITQGKGYAFDCSSLSKLSDLLTATGYPEVMLNNTPIFTPDNQAIVDLKISEQPQITCDSSADGSSKVFYHSLLDGENKYFFSDKNLSPYRLYMLGCQGLVDAMGFDLGAAQELDPNLIDQYQLFTVDDADDISCFSGSPVGTGLSWEPAEDVNLELEPGDHVFETFTASYADGDLAPLSFVKTGDCDWLGTSPFQGSLIVDGNVPADFYGKECAVIVTGASGSFFEASRMLVITSADPGEVIWDSGVDVDISLNSGDEAEYLYAAHFASGSTAALDFQIPAPCEGLITASVSAADELSLLVKVDSDDYLGLECEFPITAAPGTLRESVKTFKVTVPDLVWTIANSKAELQSILNVTNPPEYIKLNFADASYLYRDVIQPIDPDFEKISLVQWDVSSVTDMSYFFYYYVDSTTKGTSFNQDISGWDVSNVTSMHRMFYYARSFNQPIGSWNVYNVTSMERMFTFAESFNQPIGSWNIANVTSMYRMFYYASSFNQNLNSWTPTSLTSKSDTFLGSPLANNPPTWY